MPETPHRADPKVVGLKTQFEAMSPANRAAAERYVNLRRLHRLSPGSLYNYASILRKLDAFLDGAPFSEATPDELLQFLTEQHDQVSVASVVGYIRLLRKYFLDTNDGKLPEGYGQILTTRDPPPPEKANLVEKAFLEALLAACTMLQRSTRMHRIEHNQAFLYALWDTGMRQSELLSLKHRDVAFTDDGGVTLSLDPRHRDLKTGARTVTVYECTGILQAWLSLHPNPAPGSYVFVPTTRPDGSLPLGKVEADRLVKRVAKVAGLFQDARKPLSCHDFRHSSATRRARLGWMEDDLRRLHGWSRTSRMPSRYIHKNHEDLRALARRDAGLDANGVRGLVREGDDAAALAALLERLMVRNRSKAL